MPNRTVCSIIEEARKCCDTLNFSYMRGLLEEIQTCVNRMEAALYDQSDLEYARKEYKKLKAELESLEEKKNFLEKKD